MPLDLLLWQILKALLNLQSSLTQAKFPLMSVGGGWHQSQNLAYRTLLLIWYLTNINPCPYYVTS